MTDIESDFLAKVFYLGACVGNCVDGELPDMGCVIDVFQRCGRVSLEDWKVAVNAIQEYFESGVRPTNLTKLQQQVFDTVDVRLMKQYCH